MFFQDTLNQSGNTFNWILQRNGFQTANDFRKYLESKNVILDAGW